MGIRTQSVRLGAKVAEIMEHHDAHAHFHATRQEKLGAQSKRRTMQRLKARAQLKQSQRMRKVAIFRDMDDSVLSAMIDKMTLQKFKVGDTIIKQGDVADAFFIIMEGMCKVRRKTLVDAVHGQVIGQLGSFEHFGEAALKTAVRRVFLRKSGMSGEVKEELRNASVVAAGRISGGDATAENDVVKVLRLSSTDVEELLNSDSIDIVELQKKIDEQNATRESLSAARHVWGHSLLYAKLEGKRRENKAVMGRSLFG